MAYQTHDPSTGETTAEFEQSQDTERILRTAVEGYESWSRVDPAERAAVLRRVGDRFAARRDELARVITTEMGKLPDEALAEVDLAASIYRWYGDHGPDLLSSETLDV